MTDSPKEYTLNGYAIQAEDLPEDMQAVADLIGMDAALLMCAHFGAERVYFHKLDSIVKAARNRKIVAEFDGCNHMTLARKYNLCSTRIRQILADADPGRRVDKQEQKPLFPDM